MRNTVQLPCRREYYEREGGKADTNVFSMHPCPVSQAEERARVREYWGRLKEGESNQRKGRRRSRRGTYGDTIEVSTIIQSGVSLAIAELTFSLVGC